MNVCERIAKEIEDLQQQLDELKARDYLTGVRVERTPAGGTASSNAKNECKYARLRAGKGKLLDNGKKSKYIPLQEIEKYTAMCSRGKTITQLDRAIQRRQKKLKWLTSIISDFTL
ncbi:hypothetical protein S7335_642 [Synechococcus sp. PCC 7335]|uniref:hypothetical protein n=1 Tax=Synechococcus sp. (strain ATCC 29403 / PCC 7335) TaxID=91464 RepID=UPI00017EC0A8|nr:hypothetical protein [Synechococcus sp. PCC 7335]EDX83462.1 hypothetical protein S7335_642 [Synechococcus sp. PCC 7335]